MTRVLRMARFEASSLIVVLTLFAPFAQAASVEEATKGQLKLATEYYDRGVEAMDADKFTEALTQFPKSYDTVASPNSHLMVGRALVKLGRLPEAYRELTQTIQQATRTGVPQKKYKKTLETAQKELDDIKGKLAYVTLRQGTRVQIQGRSVESTSWQEPQAVTPGTVLVEVRYPDGRQLTRQLTLKPGETSDFEIAPPPTSATATVPGAPTPVTPAALTSERGATGMSRKTAGYVFGAVGVVGVGAFVGFGLIGASSYSNAKNDCTTLGCPESSVNKEGSKGLMKGIGYAGLGIGILGLGAGTWLILSGDSKSAATTSLQIGPSGLQLAHRF